MLRSSDLTEFISIERRGGRTNENDEPLPDDWVTHDQVWASVLFISGKEHVISGAVRSSAIASIRIRFREDIDSEMRIRYGNQLYDIVAVLPNRKNGSLDLPVKVGEKYV
ncbi:phage head closure protein [Burkholderia multivorans]|uniref:phage head closure protein n=1 Tax=Burkholderia multivorans TaxID=87883 RepID=UPI0006A5B215|nr:phage head closure protein [Burkholderia multivorans]KOE23088.1 head-tail adaptor protein [Burkholderia multivorans R-20526]